MFDTIRSVRHFTSCSKQKGLEWLMLLLSQTLGRRTSAEVKNNLGVLFFGASVVVTFDQRSFEYFCVILSAACEALGTPEGDPGPVYMR